MNNKTKYCNMYKCMYNTKQIFIAGMLQKTQICKENSEEITHTQGILVFN